MWHLTRTAQVTLKEGDFTREDGEQAVQTADSWNQPTPPQREETLPLVGANRKQLLRRLFSVESSLSPARGGSHREQWPWKSLKQLKKMKTQSYFFLIIIALNPTSALGYSGGSQVSNSFENLLAYDICWRSLVFLLMTNSLSEYTCADFSRSDLIKLCQILQRFQWQNISLFNFSLHN